MGYHQVNVQTRKDLAKAEAIAIPLTTIVLIWVFGSLIAALLPLAVGLFSIISTMATLRGLALGTDVSIYALNMTTALGLALAIDYSLFIVSRYREEIRAGRRPDEAVDPHRADGRAHRAVLGAHRRPVAGRAARVPAVLPALVRLRRHRGGRAGRGGGAAGAARAARVARPPGGLARPAGAGAPRGCAARRRVAIEPEQSVLVPRRARRSCAGRCRSASRSSAVLVRPRLRRSSARSSAIRTTGCCRPRRRARQVGDAVRTDFSQNASGHPDRWSRRTSRNRADAVGTYAAPSVHCGRRYGASRRPPARTSHGSGSRRRPDRR